MNATQERPRFDAYAWLTVIMIAMIGGYRLWAALHNPFPLFVDEAYYWTWSRQLDWGYYSKPPMVALLIALTTSLCGDAEFCVRSSALLLYPITTVLVFLIARRLFDTRIAFWSATAFYTLPSVALSSMVISTDVPLFLCWAASVWLFLRALERDRVMDWVALGLVIGLGLMSKYTMLIFPVSMLLWLKWGAQPGYPALTWRVWLALAVGTLVFLPNLWWNAVHAFATFQHTLHISNLRNAALHLSELAEFTAGQFGVFGPVFFAALIILWLRPSQWLDDWRFRFLTAFSLPLLLVMTLQSLLGRANANWAAPSFVTAAILAVGWLILRRRWGTLSLALATQIALMPVIYHYDAVADALGIPKTSAADPFKRVRGWDRFGEALRRIADQYPDARLLAQDRESLSYLCYYVTQGREAVYALSEDGRVRSQFDLGVALPLDEAARYLYVRRKTARPLSLAVAAQPAHAIRIPIYEDYSLEFEVYLLQDRELRAAQQVRQREPVIKVPARYARPTAEPPKSD